MRMKRRIQKMRMRTRIPHSLLMLLLVWAMLILVGCHTGRDFVKGADVGSLSQ